MSGYLFKNVTILNCTGENPFQGEVLVEGNKISAIARNGESLNQNNVDIINGENRMTLMPGLIESHAHLSIDNTDDLAAL